LGDDGVPRRTPRPRPRPRPRWTTSGSIGRLETSDVVDIECPSLSLSLSLNNDAAQQHTTPSTNRLTDLASSILDTKPHALHSERVLWWWWWCDLSWCCVIARHFSREATAVAASSDRMLAINNMYCNVLDVTSTSTNLASKCQIQLVQSRAPLTTTRAIVQQ
jgi:hypothetical protein